MKKVIVLSADALVREDIEHLSTLPNFKKYLSGGAEIREMKTVYPTITYPAHVTLSTGVYPARHGIVGNYQIPPERDFTEGIHPYPWRWFYDAVKVPDVFTAVKNAGFSTGAVFWPVTGNHPFIDYLIDEYWTQGPNDSKLDAFRRSGSSEDVLSHIVAKYQDILEERKHPECDYFIMNCAAEMIRRYNPDLMMVHPANVDGYRHSYGLFHPTVTKGVEETDAFLGMLAEAAIDAGTFDDTDFILLSDHGQLDIKRVVNLNVILRDRGYIDINDTGTPTSWRAFCHSGGMSALVFLQDKTDKKLHSEVYDLLCWMRDEGIYGISEVMTEAECREREHLGGEFSFVLETDGYTAFGDSCRRPLVSHFDASDYRKGRATHGYHPDKGPQPIFIAKGPSFRPNTIIDRAPSVNVAPTIAKIFDTILPDSDGIPLHELLK